MAIEDDLNWTQTTKTPQSLWENSQERQWPTKLNVLPQKTPNIALCATRERRPAAVLKSPFMPNDARGDDFLKFMRSRNGGK